MRTNLAVRIGPPFLLGVSTCGYVPAQEVLARNAIRVCADGDSAQKHLYIFQPGRKSDSPHWVKTGNGLGYETDFGDIHFLARATLVEDGIVFYYEFLNRSGNDYDTSICWLPKPPTG